jgi:hypothetical protein
MDELMEGTYPSNHPSFQVTLAHQLGERSGDFLHRVDKPPSSELVLRTFE